MNLPAQELGKWGEELAANFLIQQGFSIIARNVYTPYGELDLIAQNPGDSTHECIVFVEVKTRRSRRFGYPEEAVTSSKQEHLKSAALHYLQEHPELETVWRFDVIAIECSQNQEPIIHHFDNALSG